MIVETFIIRSPTTDVLAAPSRLNSLPPSSRLIIEVSASDLNTGANSSRAAITIQQPDGFVAVDKNIIPWNGYDSTRHILHNDTALVFEFEAGQGLHFNIDITQESLGNGNFPEVILRATVLP